LRASYEHYHSQAKVQASFYSQHCTTASIFPHNKFGLLSLSNEFKVNNTLDIIKESDKHFLGL
jgi:hypothetical protein